MLPDDRPPRAAALQIVALLVFYGIAAVVGGVMFVALNRVLANLGPAILFYRGVLSLVCVGALLVVLLTATLPGPLRRFGLCAKDAVGASIVAVSLLLAAFVLGPVTVDRSISVFLLSQFEQAPTPLSPEAARDAFVRVYIDQWGQIDRRLQEQTASGNLEKTSQGLILTAQGRAFMRTARLMAKIFDTDERFVGRGR